MNWVLWTVVAIAVVWALALTFLRKIWFFRDPLRTPDSTDNAIIAPASGRVVYIRQVKAGLVHSEKLGEVIPLPEITGCDTDSQDGWAIGIYMSPLDVHFNYCPFPGTVTGIFRKSASVNYPMLDLWEYIRVVWLKKMVDMFARKYHLENERNTIFLDCGIARMAVVLIADKFVAKITCYVKEGQKLGYSEKLGFIQRGSQVDLVVFGVDLDFKVDINTQVHGGKTVVATIKAKEALT